jgi:hypothetical protein
MTVGELIEALSKMPKGDRVVFNAQGEVDVYLNGRTIKAEVAEAPIAIYQAVRVRLKIKGLRKRPIVVMLSPNFRQLDDACREGMRAKKA